MLKMECNDREIKEFFNKYNIPPEAYGEYMILIENSLKKIANHILFQSVQSDVVSAKAVSRTESGALPPKAVYKRGQCKANTKQGTPCKLLAEDGKYFCKRHKDQGAEQEEKCNAIVSSGGLCPARGVKIRPEGASKTYCYRHEGDWQKFEGASGDEVKDEVKVEVKDEVKDEVIIPSVESLVVGGKKHKRPTIRNSKIASLVKSSSREGKSELGEFKEDRVLELEDFKKLIFLSKLNVVQKGIYDDFKRKYYDEYSKLIDPIKERLNYINTNNVDKKEKDHFVFKYVRVIQEIQEVGEMKKLIDDTDIIKGSRVDVLRNKYPVEYDMYRERYKFLKSNPELKGYVN